MNHRQTTGSGLSAESAFIGLVDFGLFAEKIPACFTSKGLAERVPLAMKDIISQNDGKKLKRHLDKRTRGFVRYQTLRDVNIPRHMGIPHPENYLAQCLAIKSCCDQIKLRCTASFTPDFPVIQSS